MSTETTSEAITSFENNGYKVDAVKEEWRVRNFNKRTGELLYDKIYTSAELRQYAMIYNPILRVK